MAKYPVLHLRSGREASLANRHPWIFSGALEKVPEDLPHGAIVNVIDSTGKIAATGTYSAKSMIAVRVLQFGETIIDKDWLKRQIQQAHARRQLLGYRDNSQTNGYRVVFGEADWLSGLVVDRYADVLVIQLATAGMDNLRNIIIEALVELFKPTAIYERSDLPSRTEEGLAETTGLRYGTETELVEFSQNGRRFVADIANGQKTGFYLDQKNLREEVSCLALGRKVLDLFSYSGATSIAALAGGALSAHCVDSSATALELCLKQAALNSIESSRISCETADVFQWLSTESTPQYDMVLLDPPALIKSRKHAEDGRKGYHFLNRAALRLINNNGLLVTSSCSACFTEEQLSITLRRAAEQAGINLFLLKTVRQSSDHPLSLHFPEAAYLKSFICQVSR